MAPTKEIIKQHLEQLENEHGRLTAEIVVQDAKNPESPLHDAGFQWDVEKAAHQQWLDHARKLISSVEYVVRTERHTISAVAWVRDPRLVGTKQQGYVQVSKLADDQTLARQSLDFEITRALAVIKRVQSLAIVLNLDARLDGMIDELMTLKPPSPDAPAVVQ